MAAPIDFAPDKKRGESLGAGLDRFEVLLLPLFDELLPSLDGIFAVFEEALVRLGLALIHSLSEPSPCFSFETSCHSSFRG